MTTEEIRAAFRDRPTFNRPAGAYALYLESFAVEQAACEVWGSWWWGLMDDAATEAAAWQVTDWLSRLSGILAVESARLTVAEYR